MPALDAAIHVVPHNPLFQNIFLRRHADRRVKPGDDDRANHDHASGSVTVKVLPWPGTESTAMAPPWFSATRLQMARPMPVPS